MKIAVSSEGPGIDSQMDQRFGRCPYFVLVDTDTMEFESVENEGAMASGGAGTSTGMAIAKKGIKAVLTGNCGPKAYSVLNAAGIEVYTGISGTVKSAVEQYKNGGLTGNGGPNVPSHSGNK